MEDDKKKKKNKKKKNKQQAKSAAEDTSSNAGNGKASSQEPSHDSEKNATNQSVEYTDRAGDNGMNTNVDNGVGPNAEATNGSLSADIGKQNWLHEEAKLRDMIRKLLYEKDTYMQLEADLEVKIKELQSDNNSWHQKEVALEQRISQLLLEQASLSCEKKDLQEKVRHIEKEKALLVEKENSSKEMIASLNDEVNRLRMQVVELEGAKDSISLANKQLMSNISMLQSQIQDPEGSLASASSSIDAQKDAAEKENLKAEIEAACALVEKLVTENAEMVEKLNNLYKELGPRNVASNATSVEIRNHTTVQDPTFESNKDIFSSSTSNSEIVPIMEDKQYDMNMDHAHNVSQQSSNTIVSGEIVQIPLDENVAQRDLEAQPSFNNEGGQEERENENVPITDAPLIGAPFRLVSFVAKYVSGADLVNKTSSG